MIQIIINVDSVEDENGEDGEVITTYKCYWRVVSDETTSEEEDATQYLLLKIKEMFDDLMTNVLLSGGAVQHIKDEDYEE